MKHKLAFLVIVILFLLSVACSDGGGDTNTTTTTTIDESCWQRVYNECTDGGNGIWTCNDMAKETCGAD